MAHSKIVGGSTASRLINCPGSRREAAKNPRPDTSSPAAELGTALHEVMEALFNDDTEKLTPLSFVGYRAQNGIDITEEHVLTKVAPAFDAVMEIFNTYDVVEYMTEAHVHFEDNPEVFGSADLLCMTAGGTLLVLDYKFGDGVMVSPADNAQFLFYATAALETPALASFVEGATKLAVGVIQPSDRREDVYEMHTHHTPSALAKRTAIAANKPPAANVKALMTFKHDLFTAIAESEKPDAPTAIGPWCKFCPAEATCPSKTGAARAAVTLDPNALDTLADNLDTADQLESWIASVRKLAHTQLENGVHVRGRKLVAKRATRKWSDEQALDDHLRKTVYTEGTLHPVDVHSTTLLSPAQMEKVFKKLKVDFKLLDPYIVSKSSGLTMAASDDPRPEAAATLDAALAGLSAVLPQ